VESDHNAIYVNGLETFDMTMELRNRVLAISTLLTRIANQANAQVFEHYITGDWVKTEYRCAQELLCHAQVDSMMKFII
jgi:hypothetical protein